MISMNSTVQTVIKSNRANQGIFGVPPRAWQSKGSLHVPFFILKLLGSAIAVASISGCAAMSKDNPSLYSVDRAEDYPVTIVAATFVPTIDIEFSNSGKLGGALSFAGRGLVECFPLLAVPYLWPFCAAPVIALGAVGAVTTPPKSEGDPVRLASQNNHGKAAQEMLAEKAGIYLADISTKLISQAGPEVTGPSSISDRPEYKAPLPTARGSLLELSILNIRYYGFDATNPFRFDGYPLVCLRMTVRGRKIDAVTSKVIDTMDYTRTIECQTVEQWLTDGGIRFRTALEDGYLILAETLIDRLYLVYYPPRRERGSGDPARPVPEYVLAPITPPAPEVYLDFRSITKKAKHVQGFGGMHFVDVDSLTPDFSWEAFPRPFDMPVGENSFTNITYDIRIYASSVWTLAPEPTTLLQEVTGLVEPRYSVATPLQPCKHYFWTVRARFNLNGIRRVTEWAGAYFTVGGEVSPSHIYYYPFRTPGSGDTAGCWS